MHADEIRTDAALVSRLLASQFPGWAELFIEPVASSGTDNAIYRLGDDMAVRLPRIHWAVSQVDREHAWLPRLAPLLPLAVPVPLAKGAPGEGYPWPWSVVRWIEGRNPSFDHLPRADDLAARLAEFIAALHTIDTAGGPPAGRENSGRGAPLAARDEATHLAIGQLDGQIDTAAARAAWDRAVAAPAWAGAPTWVHGDLSPGNVVCVDDRLEGVIDFGCLGVGDPAVDLAVAWNLLPGHARDGFRSALGADDATWERGRGWALSIALIQLPYYHETNPALAANAEHVLHEVLT